jgi:hypothetical protein
MSNPFPGYPELMLRLRGEYSRTHRTCWTGTTMMAVPVYAKMDPLVVNGTGELALYTPGGTEDNSTYSWTVASVLTGSQGCAALGYLAARQNRSQTGCLTDPKQCGGDWDVRPGNASTSTWVHDSTLRFERGLVCGENGELDTTGVCSCTAGAPGWWQRLWDWLTGITTTELSYHGESCEHACAPGIDFVDGECACGFDHMVPWVLQPSFLPAIGMDAQCSETTVGGEFYILGVAGAEIGILLLAFSVLMRMCKNRIQLADGTEDTCSWVCIAVTSLVTYVAVVAFILAGFGRYGVWCQVIFTPIFSMIVGMCVEFPLFGCRGWESTCQRPVKFKFLAQFILACGTSVAVAVAMTVLGPAIAVLPLLAGFAILGAIGDAMGGGDDIGDFGYHHSTPGAEFLHGEPTSATASDVRKLVLQLGGSTTEPMSSTGLPFTSHTGHNLLGLSARDSLIDLLDERYRSDGHPVDLKLDLSEAELISKIGDKAYRGLVALFGSPAANQIKLRRVEAHGQCINFHLDHSLRTMQVRHCQPSTVSCIAAVCVHGTVFASRFDSLALALDLQVPLNDETDYIGGRLVFACADGLHQPCRRAGSATIHDNTIVSNYAPALS